MKNKAIIGVDLGGTSISVGKVSGEKIVKEIKQSVPAQADNPQIITDFIIQAIDSVFDKEIESIGLGIPGLLNSKEGIIYDVQNIPSWKDIHLKDILEERFKVNVFIDNDANCFALGERIYGKGKKTHSFVGVTLGTGMGAGIVCNGNLHSDLNGGAGEFGMIPYLDATYEDYCSGKFFEMKYCLNGVEMFKKVEAGETDAIKAYNEFGQHLGNALKAIIFSVDPEKIILGGSIAVAREYFENEMLKEMNSRVVTKYQKQTKVEFSELNGTAILGAAALCFNS